MKSQSIKIIKKQFYREWLLIAVDKLDESTTTPLTGRLLAHSPHRDEVWTKLRKMRRPKLPLIEYSEDNLPQGFIAAF